MTTSPGDVGDLFPTLHPGGRITAAHPTGCYYVNLITNSIQRQCNPIIAAGMGAAGYWGTGGVPATAFNAFPTFEAAAKFANDVKTGKLKILQYPFNESGTGLAGQGSGSPGQTDWNNLTIRLAEFAIGAILITIGLVAILGKTKTGQTAINIAMLTPPGRAVRAEQTARSIVRERAETKRIKRRVRSMES